MKGSNLVRYKEQILKLFKCQKSGNCCTCPGAVYVSFHEKSNMAKSLNMTTLEFTNRFIQKKNGWEMVANNKFRPRCFLDENNNCSVYLARPISCKSYPNWDSIWQTDSALINESNQCPGLKQALQDFKKLQIKSK